MKYEVIETSVGYAIKKENKKLLLPYNFCSKQYAHEACEEFNKYGEIAECCYYYTHKVAGNRTPKDYKYAYEKWIIESYKNFI